MSQNISQAASASVPSDMGGVVEHFENVVTANFQRAAADQKRAAAEQQRHYDEMMYEVRSVRASMNLCASHIINGGLSLLSSPAPFRPPLVPECFASQAPFRPIVPAPEYVRPVIPVTASVPGKSIDAVSTPSIASGVNGLRWPRQSRSLSTVEQVWNEYAHGFPGEMSVREAEIQYQRLKDEDRNKAFNWRKAEKDKVHFSRRKVCPSSRSLLARVIHSLKYACRISTITSRI